ncbi:MAG: hypothetical protein JSW46_13725 [Gemmatimonadota bacterium]|nr:MAG: hypothetical protein JSW46_13725 [Gemmatimonadota bacterium]
MVEVTESIEPVRAAADRQTVVRLALAVIAAFALRAVLLWLRGDFLDYDESMYLLIARSMLEGDGVTLNGLPHTALGPFVPAATATLARLTGTALLTSQRILTALCGALALIPIWYLLRLYARDQVVWIAVSLLAVWPALIDVAPKYGVMWHDMYAGTEPTFLLLLFASLAAGEAALRRRGWLGLALAALAGASLALAYTTRAEAIVFAGLYFVIRVLQSIRAGVADRRRLALAVMALLGFFVFASPQLAYLHRATGEWMLSGQPAVMRPAAEALQESFRFRDREAALSFLRTWYWLDEGHTYLLNPYFGTPEGVSRAGQKREYAEFAAAEAPTQRRLPARVANRLKNYGLALWAVCGLLFLPFALLGIIRERRRLIPPFVAAAFAASVLTSVYLAALPRFFLYLAPAFALWAAHGVVGLGEYLRRFGDGRRFTPHIQVALIVVAALSVLRVAGGAGARYLESVAGEDREVAESLAGALPEGDPVMHWHPKFAFWGGWEWRTMPLAPLDDIAHYAATLEVRHVLLARGGYTPVRAELEYLYVALDPDLLAVLLASGAADSVAHEHPAMDLRPALLTGGQETAALILDDGQVE